jgi:aspartyl/asparaginyl-tRNA synthetase
MGIAIILDEINKYIDMLKHHHKDLYILEKAYIEIQELYDKLDELNNTYNACIDLLYKEGETPY